MQQNHAKGHRAEALACGYLRACGFTILQRNYRVRGAEVDIIARSPEGDIAFVEVKSSCTSAAGRPEARVTDTKLRRIAWAAQCWLQATGQEDQPCRFDVLALRMGEQRQRGWVHYPHAYMPDLSPVRR